MTGVKGKAGCEEGLLMSVTCCGQDKLVEAMPCVDGVQQLVGRAESKSGRTA